MSQRNDQISIVIPTFQSPQLEHTLEAIAQLKELELAREVLVVGQQNEFDIPDLPNFRYIKIYENPTPAHNRNVGALAANSEWLCFTDSDCQPDQDWLQEISMAIQPDRVAIAGSVCIPREMPYWGVCDHLLAFEFQAAETAKPGEIPYAATLNFCVRRDIFFTLGGFDENFTTAGGEDRDFGWRLEQAGYSIEYVPSAKVLHNHFRHNFSSAWRHIYNYGCVTARFRQKHAKKNPQIWQIFRKVASIPIVGETAGVFRAMTRNLVRPWQQTSYRRLLKFIPGITLLDIAHTLGTVHTLRKTR